MNGDGLEVMRALVAADVLVISPSSFSYAALGLVFYEAVSWPDLGGRRHQSPAAQDCR
jgi:hypothetical protein